MSLTACVDSDDQFREAVDLIWFPTGGGKTEAYLGLAAFTMFFQRLITEDSTGVQILMRYTLRLADNSTVHPCCNSYLCHGVHSHRQE